MFSRLNYKTQKKILITAFLAVPLLLLAVFSYLPLVWMFIYSFHDWNGYSKNMAYVGLKNYIDLFTRPEYFSVFKVSLYYFGASLVQIALALYFASVLSFKLKGKEFFKGVLFFPYLLNGVAIAFIFLYFFRPDGTLDTLLRILGLGDRIQLWLGNPQIINFSLAGTSVWRYMGFNFILFLGSIQSVSGDLYEAAELDGANRWHQFWYIIFPSIRRIIELNLILSISGSISAFEIPYIMTGGSNGSKTFVIQTVDTAFKFQKFGMASAMGIVLLSIVIAVTLIQRRIFSEKEV
ncbi:MAG: raffinose/stachyose/melibiose transport system permease protein [Petroclostridium sp.]|nr:transporter permease [Clostridia bacterium]MDK2811173.1 raffinose/stachyose/melibiose transport system permease protein [Petroclostridium sp.]